MTLFYILSPLPTVLARRYQDDVGSSNACKELALFITAGIVISAYGLPLILARSPEEPVVSPDYDLYLILAPFIPMSDSFDPLLT